MCSSSDKNVLIVGAIFWLVGVIAIYFECKRLDIDVQEYIDELDRYDREDEYMYKQLMKDIKHDK